MADYRRPPGGPGRPVPVAGAGTGAGGAGFGLDRFWSLPFRRTTSYERLRKDRDSDDDDASWRLGGGVDTAAATALGGSAANDGWASTTTDLEEDADAVLLDDFNNGRGAAARPSRGVVRGRSRTSWVRRCSAVFAQGWHRCTVWFTGWPSQGGHGQRRRQLPSKPGRTLRLPRTHRQVWNRGGQRGRLTFGEHETKLPACSGACRRCQRGLPAQRDPQPKVQCLQLCLHGAAGTGPIQHAALADAGRSRLTSLRSSCCAALFSSRTFSTCTFSWWLYPSSSLCYASVRDGIHLHLRISRRLTYE